MMNHWRVIPETCGVLAVFAGLWQLSPPWALIVVGGAVVAASFLGRMKDA